MLFDKPVTKVGGFASKYNLLTIELPDSVTTIAASAFDQCRYLQRINIPESVTEVGSSAFQTCSALAEVHVTNLTKYLNIKFPAYSTHVRYGGLYVNGVLLTDLVIPAGIESIGKCAFYSYSHLKNIIIPDSVTSIGEYAFSSCKNLERVTIGKGVKNFGSSTFVSSTGELYINCNIPSNSTGIFCKTLFTKVTIGDNVTSIGNYAFRQCTSLREVIVGGNVASIGSNVFDACSNLASINMPNNITSIGSNAFYNCSGLQRLDIDNLAA
jgi:hypothetical protein